MQVKDRQLEILETAGAVLTKQGIGGVRAKNLVRRVGFVESARYRYHGSKEEIVGALLQWRLSDFGFDLERAGQ